MWTAFALAIVYASILGGWAAWLHARVAAGLPAWPAIVALPLLWFAIPLVVTTLSFVVARLFRAPRPAHVSMSPRAFARLFWREFVTIAGNAPRMMLYRWLVPDPPAAPATRPVLLLHGVLCNAGVWQRVRASLASKGIGPVYTLSYGPPLASIDLFVGQVAHKIDAILRDTGAKDVVIVGHSMGGIVARAYVDRHGTAKVRKLITVGTPHEGSVHARLVPGTSLSQLRPGNAWLAALGDRVPPPSPPIVSLWSWHDSMVAPQTSSRIAYGENVELAGVGHNALLSDPAVAERIAEEIRRA